MSNQITIYEKVGDLTNYIQVVGKAIHQSGGMFGCKTEGQGIVLALACLAENSNLIDYARRFHIMPTGNIQKKYDASLADFRAAGGKHKVIERSPEKAEIELTYEGETNRFAFTWEEAQQEPFVWTKDKKTGETVLQFNYATPRKRMQMMWARVVTDAIKTVAPEINFGTYDPAEIPDDGDQQPEKVKLEKVKAESALPSTPPANNDEPIDASFEVVEEQKAETTNTVDPAQELRDKINQEFPAEETKPRAKPTREQLEKIAELKQEAKIGNESWGQLIDTYGVASARSLLPEEANALIQYLTNHVHTLKTRSKESEWVDTGDVAEPIDETIPF